MNTHPTEGGLLRYPETGGFYEEIPCTCKEDCNDPCRGECGCRACVNAYIDVLEYD
jgi:hypothetical protein